MAIPPNHEPTKEFASKAMSDIRYPSIADYGFIADCHSAALISTAGSIDWCCMPRFDSPPCFSRLLGWDTGGHFQIAPAAPYETTRSYLGNTLVLETVFHTDRGAARLLDCFTMQPGGRHSPHQQILRIIEGGRGTVDLTIEISPIFDYGAVKPWIRECGDKTFTAMGSAQGLLISGDPPLKMQDRHRLIGHISLSKDERSRISVLWRRPADLAECLPETPSTEELDRRMEETIQWWRRWSDEGTFVDGPYADLVRRSAIAIKGLINAPTGAIAAAATTSLPESPGGSRNWDYRFTWVRDASFAVEALAEIGHIKEADGFRQFIERSAAGSASQLQIAFGIGGERRLIEYEVESLEGYRGARPVRVGNAAWKQIQLDAYGELLLLSHHWHGRGWPPDPDYWEFLTELVNLTCRQWQQPDRGIWEIRGESRHFVHSKAMCWAALECGIRIAEEAKCPAPTDLWKRNRDEIREAVEHDGYEPKRGVFIQAFDQPIMDASLLLLPKTGLVTYDDERMVRTTDAIREDLEQDGLLVRYPPGSDHLGGNEGFFLACSFWLVECLAHQGRLAAARKVFDRAISTGNELGLFSEEYDPKQNEMMGNFPQLLSHLALISAAVSLRKNQDT